MAQRAETTVTECSLPACVWARFLLGSHTMPVQRHSQPTPTSLGIKVYACFRCNLPPAFLAQWPGSFTCHCSSTGLEWTLSKSQHTKLTVEKKILPLLLLGFELATFQSWVKRSYQQAFLALRMVSRHPEKPMHAPAHLSEVSLGIIARGISLKASRGNIQSAGEVRSQGERNRSY